MINVRLLRHLWSFLAVAEERHFGRAAKRLGISQPPLTEQIQALERSLGIRLFERSRRGAALTREGEAILPAVQRFAEQMSHLEGVVRAAKEGKKEFIAIGAITPAFYDVLPKVLKIVAAELPEVTTSFVELHTAQAVTMLQSGTVDVVFARLVRSVGSIRVVPLVTDKLVVALSRDHPFASRTKIAIEDLANEPWVYVRRQLSPPYFDGVISACAEAGFSPRLAHEVGSEASQVAFVSCGLGVAILPGNLSRIVAPNVAFRPLADTNDIVTASLAWDEGRITPAGQALIEIARRRSTLGSP